MPAGRAWSTLGSCGFTSLSLPGCGICLFSVGEFCDFSSEPGGSCPVSLPLQGSMGGIPPPTAHNPSSPTASLGSRKRGGVESGNLCGDTSFVGPLVSQAPPQVSLGLALPPACPQKMRIHGPATWVAVYLLPRGTPSPVLPEIVLSNLRIDCQAQQGLWHPVPTLGPAPRPYHWLTLLGG